MSTFEINIMEGYAEVVVLVYVLYDCLEKMAETCWRGRSVSEKYLFRFAHVNGSEPSQMAIYECNMIYPPLVCIATSR